MIPNKFYLCSLLPEILQKWNSIKTSYDPHKLQKRCQMGNFNEFEFTSFSRNGNIPGYLCIDFQTFDAKSHRFRPDHYIGILLPDEDNGSASIIFQGNINKDILEHVVAGFWEGLKGYKA